MSGSLGTVGDDAVAALTAIGFSPNDAEEQVRKLRKEMPGAGVQVGRSAARR